MLNDLDRDLATFMPKRDADMLSMAVIPAEKIMQYEVLSGNGAVDRWWHKFAPKRVVGFFHFLHVTRMARKYSRYVRLMRHAAARTITDPNYARYITESEALLKTQLDELTKKFKT